MLHKKHFVLIWKCELFFQLFLDLQMQLLCLHISKYPGPTVGAKEPANKMQK